jgi:hypothetical protein
MADEPDRLKNETGPMKTPSHFVARRELGRRARRVFSRVAAACLLIGGLLMASGGIATAAPPTSNFPIAGVAADATGGGYWAVAQDGGVFSFGDAQFYGSLGGQPLNAPVVGIAATPSGHGYWLVAADGGVFAYGDAGFYGSAATTRLNQAVVGMAVTPSGHGYWLAAADGGVFAYGDAVFYGSTANDHLRGAIVGIGTDRATGGYWLVGSDGGVFSFHAPFYGSLGNQTLNKGVVGITTTPSGQGYLLVAADGGVFAYGDAAFHGSMGGQNLNAPVAAIALNPDGQGYRLVATDGGVFAFNTTYQGRPTYVQATCAATPGAGDNVTRWTPVVICVLSMLHQPTTTEYVNDVLIVIRHESGGNPNAVNNNDSNAQNGTPSKGLAQVIGPTFTRYRSSVLPDDVLNPASNIYAGMNYGINRYVSIPNIPGVKAVNRGDPYLPY